MATSAALIAAAQDRDLLARAIALAAESGIENPQAFIESRRHQLAAAPVDDSGTNSVASVYEFAQASYTPTPRPGEDETKVTDTHLKAAIRYLAEQ